MRQRSPLAIGDLPNLGSRLQHHYQHPGGEHGGNARSEGKRRRRAGHERQRGRPLVTDGGTDPDDEMSPGAEDSGAESEAPAEGMAVEELLLSEGVVEEMSGADDLQLTEEFEQAWYRRIERMGSGDRAIRWLAAIHEVAPEDITVEDDGERFAVDIAGGPTREWPSEAAFIAGLVVEPTLGEWIPESEWEGLPGDTRRELSARLLLFLERCPVCDGDLEMAEDVEDGSVHVSLDCPECGTRIFEGAYQ